MAPTVMDTLQSSLENNQNHCLILMINVDGVDEVDSVDHVDHVDHVDGGINKQVVLSNDCTVHICCQIQISNGIVKLTTPI